MSDKESFDKRLEDVGGKACKLIEKKAIEMKPGLDKLLDAFSSWLDRKLSA